MGHSFAFIKVDSNESATNLKTQFFTFENKFYGYLIRNQIKALIKRETRGADANEGSMQNTEIFAAFQDKKKR